MRIAQVLKCDVCGVTAPTVAYREFHNKDLCPFHFWEVEDIRLRNLIHERTSESNKHLSLVQGYWDDLKTLGPKPELTVDDPELVKQVETLPKP